MTTGIDDDDDEVLWYWSFSNFVVVFKG